LPLQPDAGYSPGYVNLITLDAVSKTLGEAPLFEGASLGIDSGDKIGFVGRNGCGKSTFLLILEGGLEPDSGQAARKRGLTVSHLEQRSAFGPGETLADFLYGGRSTLAGLHRERRALEGAGALEAGGPGAVAIEQRAAAIEAGIHAASDAAGGQGLDRAYASICTELGLADPEALMSTMSGGMVKKAALARALAPRAELLLLDEPTNHLDVETIEWLERRLLQYQGAFVLVTHDRWFLDAACSSIMEIDRRAIYKYPGSYSDYLGRRIERASALEQAESRRLANLKRELAWLGRGARARATKSERRKDSIKDMQAQALTREAAMGGFSSASRRLGKKVLVLESVSKSYDGKAVIAPYSRTFKAGERVGLIGPNGSGKTTILDLVSGRAGPDSGRVDRGENTHFAYFDQSASAIDQSLTLLAYIKQKAERIAMADGSVLSPEQLLERFLFPRAIQDLPLSRLSGGELRRAQLVRLLADSPNFLLLDEPTNDLDIDTIELLEDYLSDFPGCVLAASHDRAFLDGLADFLIVLDASGTVREFVGGYSDYRAFAAAARPAARIGAAKDSVPPKVSPAAERQRRVAKGLSFAERKELGSLLEEISALEAEKGELEALFASGAARAESIEKSNRRYAELSELLDAKTARWEELASREA
jgi:ATP-binding cassette subfamily F protein uup